MFRKLYYYIIISRPLNCLITFLTIFVAGLITVSGGFEWKGLLLASFSGSLVCAAGNIINDIFDIEIDKINKPARALPSGKISKTETWSLYLLFNIIAVLLSLIISFSAFLVVIFTIAVLSLYSYKLKSIILAGNITVAFLTGLAFIFGGVAVNNIASSIIPAVFAFLINLIREIVKDMEDVEGDYKNNVLTFPKRFGTPVSIKVITALTVILITITIFPFIYKYYKIEYFISVMIFVNVLLVYFLKSIFKDQSIENLKRLSLLLKINMVLGLMSIYLGV